MFQRLHDFLVFAWERNRAQVFAFAGFILGLLQVVDPYSLSMFLPGQWAGVAIMGLSVAIFLLQRIAGLNGDEELRREDYAGTTEDPGTDPANTDSPEY